MQVVKDISALKGNLQELRSQGHKVAFVPTMGFLHEGHLSLVKLAQQQASKVVVSIFVNPTQFNDPKDLEAYPIDLERDSKLLEELSVDVLFVPAREQIYRGSNFQTWVTSEDLSKSLEGEFRPGHFRGVSTVVTILFNLVEPDFAVFGEKDFQQLRIIEKMVEDLHFPLKILRGPLIREADGLAMSSRNVRLTPEARKAATLLSKGLFLAQSKAQKGEKSSAALIEIVMQELRTSSLITPEYVRIVDEGSLEVLDECTPNARLLLAAQVGGIRLIDNISL